MNYLQKLQPIYTSIYFFMLLGFILRASLAFGFEATGDTGGWRLAGITGIEQRQVGIGNGNPFDGDCPMTCFNWPPLTYHYFVLTRWLYLYANPFNLPDRGFYKLLPVLASSLSTGMIYVLLNQKKSSTKYIKPLTAAAIYSVHPLVLHVAGYHGQRDTIWILTTLIAMYLIKKKHYVVSAVIFAIGVSFKIPALFFAPALVLFVPTWSNKIKYASLIPIVFFFLNFPEIVTHTANVIQQVFLYPGLPGLWGFQGIITKIDQMFALSLNMHLVNQVNKIALLLSIFTTAYYFSQKTKKIEILITAVVLNVMIFSHIAAPQYLLWPLPFALLLEKKYWKYVVGYSICATYTAMHFYGFYQISWVEKPLIVSLQPFFYSHKSLMYPWDLGFLVWGFSIIFFLRLLKDVRSKK